MQWNKRYGGSDADQFTSMSQTNDGGYILGGFSVSPVSGDKSEPVWGNFGFYDYWIIKIDSVGMKQWDKTFGGVDDEKLYSIDKTSDGGYILGGFSASGISGDKTQASWGDYDFWIVKIDSAGTLQWDKRFGGTKSDALFATKQTPDRGYILSGSSKSGITGDKTQQSWGDYDMWMVKIDSAGSKLWDVRYGGNKIDQMFSMAITNDGGFILGGTTTSGITGDKTEPNKGGYDYYLVKTDSLGIKIWDKDFGGDNDEDGFGNVSQTLDGGYLLAGSSYSEISGDKTEDNLGLEEPWIVKTDESGIKQWDKTIFLNDHNEDGVAIQTNDGCYTIGTSTGTGIAGYKTQPNWDTFFNSDDYWIVKFCDTTLTSLSGISFSSSDTSVCEKFCVSFFDSSANNPATWQWIFPGGSPSSSTLQNPAGICYDAPGIYDVTLITTSANGTDTLTLPSFITVFATPPFPSITQAGYTLTSSAATSYQWQLNSVDIPGATNQSYNVLQSGLYTVIAGDSNGCVNSASWNVLITAITEISHKNIFISPNPSNGHFTIELLNMESSLNLLIHVRNSYGQIIFTSFENIISADWKKDLDLRKFPNGIYFIEVKTENELRKKKLIVAK